MSFVCGFCLVLYVWGWALTCDLYTTQIPAYWRHALL